MGMRLTGARRHGEGAGVMKCRAVGTLQTVTERRLARLLQQFAHLFA